MNTLVAQINGAFSGGSWVLTDRARVAAFLNAGWHIVW
jgi:hypothetical protein